MSTTLNGNFVEPHESWRSRVTRDGDLASKLKEAEAEVWALRRMLKAVVLQCGDNGTISVPIDVARKAEPLTLHHQPTTNHFIIHVAPVQ